MTIKRLGILGFVLLTVISTISLSLYFNDVNTVKHRKFSIRWPTGVETTKINSTDSISTANSRSEKYNCRVDFILLKTHIENSGSMMPSEVIESAMSAFRKRIIDEPSYNKKNGFIASVFFSTHDKDNGTYGVHFFSIVDDYLYLFSATSPVVDALKTPEVLGVFDSIECR